MAVNGRQGFGCGGILAVLLVIGVAMGVIQGLGQSVGVIARPTPTPYAPTPTLPPEFAQLGTIEFGASFDRDTLAIIRPAARFHANVILIAYVAHLRYAARTTDLDLVLARRSAAGAESIVWRTTFSISDPDADTVADSWGFAEFAGRRLGSYVVRILRDGDVLAEGGFTLVE